MHRCHISTVPLRLVILTCNVGPVSRLTGFILSIALELPILAGILSIINGVGDAGMLKVVGRIMAFM
jgi:hypothetical protein